MIDSSGTPQETNKVSEVEHEPESLFVLDSGKSGMDLDSRTSLVDSLLREDSEGRSHLYGVEWGGGHLMNSNTPKKPMAGPGDLVLSYTAEEHGVEAERAADVLAHYCGCSQKRGPYTYADEEEEIKV